MYKLLPNKAHTGWTEYNIPLNHCQLPPKFGKFITPETEKDKNCAKQQQTIL